MLSGWLMIHLGRHRGVGRWRDHVVREQLRVVREVRGERDEGYRHVFGAEGGHPFSSGALAEARADQLDQGGGVGDPRFRIGEARVGESRFAAGGDEHARRARPACATM